MNTLSRFQQNVEALESAKRVLLQKQDVINEKKRELANQENEVIVSLAEIQLSRQNLIREEIERFVISLQKELRAVFFPAYIEEHIHINWPKGQLFGDKDEVHVLHTLVPRDNESILRDLVSNYENIFSKAKQFSFTVASSYADK